MPLLSAVAFPLLPINPDGTCACGAPACSRVGKHPAVKWKELRLGDPVPRPREGAGVGLKTGAAPLGSGVFVVDLDGQEASDLFDEMGVCRATYTVQTPRGWHLYFKHPGFYVKTSAGELGKGIDIRGDGGFVVAPGSPHVSGAKYEVIEDPEPAEAPLWLLGWLKAQKAPAPAQSYEGDVTDPAELARRRALYAEYLQTDAPARGPALRGKGDATLFKVVQKGALDLALPNEDILELVAEHYDPRCDPPWGDELEERVLYKADYAKRSSTRERQGPTSGAEDALWAGILEPTALAKPAEPATPDDTTFGFAVRWGGWAAPPVPPSYLVDGLFVQGKVNMIFADPGSIKSWTAIDIASSVSAGRAWLGERPTVQGRVLYVDYEDGEHEFHRRVHMLTHGQERPDLGYLYTPGNLGDWGVWERLIKYQLAQSLVLLVLDTLAGGTPGVDENDRNAADALTYAGRFTERTGATVLFLHHANRSGEIRGTSAFKANVDSLFKLETLKDEDGIHQARLTCTKSGQKKVYPLGLEFSDSGLRRFEEPKAEKGSEDDKKDRRTLPELKAEVLLTIESQGPLASISMIRGLVKAKTANVSAVVSELEAAGDIVKMEDGWIRDSERARRERLQGAIQEHSDWPRGKILAHAFVTADYFERCRNKGLFRPKSSSPEIPGFIWINP